MSIIAINKKGEGFATMDAGSYPARIYQMIHLGTIAGFQGQLQNKVRIGFEMPTEMKVFDEKKGEQPRVISQDYTLSFNEKANLRKVIEACDPDALKLDKDGFLEEFDVEKLIGKDCLITVAQKESKEGRIFAFIDSVTRLPKGMSCPKAINPIQVLDYDEWDQELFDKLPDFLKDKIRTSVEYERMLNPMTDDKSPF